MFFGLELPPIGWQLFILGSSQSDPIALPAFLDTYATRLLTEPLSSELLSGLVIGCLSPRTLSSFVTFWLPNIRDEQCLAGRPAQVML